MMAEKKKICKVVFLPSGLKVEVPEGRTVLQAAQKAGVYVTSICGGDGYCGKCRLILDNGQIEAKPTTLLSREDIQKNYFLACEARIKSDLVISVPKEHELDKSPILIDKDAHRFSTMPTSVAAEITYKHEPPVRKVFLELTQPTVEQNIADHERVLIAIRKKLDIKEMQTGYRILEQLPHTLRSADWKVTATVAKRWGTYELVQIEEGDTSDNNFGIALDVGTTTVVAHLVDLVQATTVDAEATYNSQMQFGEDYIRRIIYAEQNNALDELQSCIIRDVNDLIATLADRNNVRINDISCLVVTGNTAMIHFLLRLDPTNIRRTPYTPSANFIPPLRAAEAGIKIGGRGLLYCLPSVAAYIGSDITAGVLATGLHRSRKLSLFIDIGTNGEVVLGNREWMVAASSSAGPAFEGSGIKHGMRAMAGAIEKVDILPDLSVRYRTIGAEAPKGICGSGLLDLLAGLYCVGAIDRTGSLQPGVKAERFEQTDEGIQFILVEGDEKGDGRKLVFTQPDVTNLIRSKAGVYAAISILLKIANVKPMDIECIYLAGGFGNYIDVSNAVIIGMLPDVPAERIHFVGNSSIAGAKLPLLSMDAYDAVAEIANKLTYVDLMTNEDYMEEFIKANFIPNTELERFPTVMKELESRCGKRKEGT